VDVDFWWVSLLGSLEAVVKRFEMAISSPRCFMMAGACLNGCTKGLSCEEHRELIVLVLKTDTHWSDTYLV
jgi:hypothetical protein